MNSNPLSNFDAFKGIADLNKNMNSAMAAIGQQAQRKRRMDEDNHSNTQALLDSSKSLQSLLDGESTYEAIVSSVRELKESAPEEHDTLIAAFGLVIDQVKFQNPHTIILTGYDDSGWRSSVVAHFSQIAIKVIYVPQKASEPPREVGFHTLQN